MNFISQMPSPKSLSNSFHLWFNPSSFSFSRSISTSHGSVSPRLSPHLKTEEEFLFSPYPFFERCAVQTLYHPLVIIFDCDNSFLTIRRIPGVASLLDHLKAIISEYYSQHVAIVLQILSMHRSNIL